MALAETELAAKLVPGGVFIDVKAAFNTAALQAAGLCVWRL
jgi:UDP-N-acetyl-D-galactosamine dehydrogenase